MTKKNHDDYEMGKAVGKAEAEEKAHQGLEVSIVPKELQPYANNLPYSRDRLIEELRFLFQHEVAAKFEIGKRLILLKGMEGLRQGGDRKSENRESKSELRILIPGEGVRFSDILREHFPGLSKQRAYEYILFAQKGTKKFREWAEGGKNWGKALALLDTFDEKEIKALEDGDEVQGMLFDDICTMTVTELREELRRMRKKDTRGKEQYAELQDEVRRLQKRHKPTEEQFHVEMEGFRLSFDNLMDRVEPEVMEMLKEENKPTTKMIAHYLEILGYMKKRILGALGDAENNYGTAEMIPENVWRPGMGAEVVDMMRKKAVKG